MSLIIDVNALLKSDELLIDDVNVACLAQISQEPCQGVAYRASINQLPSSVDLLSEDLDVPCLPQISQEPCQGAAYRVLNNSSKRNRLAPSR